MRGEIKQNIIKQFDKQIKQERKIFKNLDKCISYWSKLIYLESANFTLSDWKMVRSGDYYTKRDLLRNNPIEQKKLLIDRIKKYKKK